MNLHDGSLYFDTKKKIFNLKTPVFTKKSNSLLFNSQANLARTFSTLLWYVYSSMHVLTTTPYLRNKISF